MSAGTKSRRCISADDDRISLKRLLPALKQALQWKGAFERQIESLDGEEIRFRFVEVLSDIKFRGEVRKDVYFLDTKFSGEADFVGAKFAEITDFSTATFAGKAVFSGAKFSAEANFLGAISLGEARLREPRSQDVLSLGKLSSRRMLIFHAAS